MAVVLLLLVNRVIVGRSNVVLARYRCSCLRRRSRSCAACVFDVVAVFVDELCALQYMVPNNAIILYYVLTLLYVFLYHA